MRICKAPCGCDRPVRKQGDLCAPHYLQRIRGVEPLQPIRSRISRLVSCSVDGCDKPVKGLTLCKMHYMRYLRASKGKVPKTETPEPLLISRPDVLRFYLAQFDRILDYIWRLDEDYLLKFGRCKTLYCYESIYKDRLCLRCWEKAARLVVP